MRSIAFAVVIFFAACSQSKDLIPAINYENAYNVYKVDSLNSYYIIMANKGGKVFKIISRKAPGYTNGTKISEGKPYEFMIYSIWHSKIPMGNGKTLALADIMGCFTQCIGLDDSTSFCLDRDASINDLFIAENVKGLYAGKGKVVDGLHERKWRGSW